MKERPILFSAPMVRAILAGTKTQTRRVVKLRNGLYMPPSQQADINGWNQMLRNCPYGQPGDRLWVRETWRHTASSLEEARAITEDITSGIAVDWRATYIDVCMKELGFSREDAEISDSFQRWRPSIHMPRWASRITLEVTGVRVERLQNISEADAIAEGTFSYAQELYRDPRVTTADINALIAKYGEGKASCLYAALWESIIGPGSWGANPWVWVVEFTRVQP